MNEKEEIKKENLGKNEPKKIRTKSFRNFMIFQMEESQYLRFEKFCVDNGVNFAPAIVMLLNAWDSIHAYSYLHEKIEKLESMLSEKSKSKRKKRWGEA